MTDNDLRAQLARIQTALEHLQEDMQEAKCERREQTSKMESFISRLVTLETEGRYMENLPDRVAHNESQNQVQDAERKGRSETVKEIRSVVFSGIAAAGTIAAIIALILPYLVGNGG